MLRLTDENMIGPYCLSKLKSEQEAFRLADSGAPIIVACLTVPIGPEDHNLTPPSRMTLAFCQGKLPAYLDCQLNMIDARDIAFGLRAAMKVGRPRIRLPARRSKPAAHRMADDRRPSDRKRSTPLGGFIPTGIKLMRRTPANGRQIT
jgi:hypothetical protein